MLWDVTAIDTHVDDGMGVCSSEEVELNLKSGIQKFYKLKEKDTSKPFKVLGILSTGMLTKAHLSSPRLNTSIPCFSGSIWWIATQWSHQSTKGLTYMKGNWMPKKMINYIKLLLVP